MIVSGIGTQIVTADIHGMTSEDAKSQLQKLLSRVPDVTEELLVIHGYNGGQVLRDMVRGELKHPRIRSKLLSLNAGQTRILLKK
ncbi:MAG: Smr/MutS family protein [Oscillospiraceae bacterium]|nr:Smr/MutS family protein [Oscillospiraceae bacterium]